MFQSSVDVKDPSWKRKTVKLLASAGRDRLTHVFDAGNNYNPLTTLDNHSSSVTTVKFTSDGQRLLSCGGDKTLVFSSVVGPMIQRIKSIPTPHGANMFTSWHYNFIIVCGQERSTASLSTQQTNSRSPAVKIDG